MNRKLDDTISYIVNSFQYKKCIALKEKMSKNAEITDLVEKIKILQKQYVNTKDESILVELKNLEEKLQNIPIYVSYMQYLDDVNQMINYVKDELNDYFYRLLNSTEMKG